jgi:hypothetical protein
MAAEGSCMPAEGSCMPAIERCARVIRTHAAVEARNQPENAGGRAVMRTGGWRTGIRTARVPDPAEFSSHIINLVKSLHPAADPESN